MDAERFAGKARNVVTQQAHDALFPVVRRQDGNTERNLLATSFDAEASVLRESLFVESHAAQDLDTRGNGGRRMLRKFHCIVQESVDTIADEEGFLERFNMDVRRVLRIRM